MKKLTVEEMKELLKDTRIQPTSFNPSLNISNSKYVQVTGSFFKWTQYQML